jgi:hypothetical protein
MPEKESAPRLRRARLPKLQRRQGPGRKPPRWSAERRACVSLSKRNGRAAPHPRGSLAPKGATKRRRCASRRSAHPSTRWVKMKLTRARRRMGTSRCALFDIVRWTTNTSELSRVPDAMQRERQRSLKRVHARLRRAMASLIRDHHGSERSRVCNAPFASLMLRCARDTRALRRRFVRDC